MFREMVSVSSDNQIVISSQICKLWGVRPGQRIQFTLSDDRVELLPLPSTMEEARGFLKGVDTTVERRPDRA